MDREDWQAKVHGARKQSDTTGRLTLSTLPNPHEQARVPRTLPVAPSPPARPSPVFLFHADSIRPGSEASTLSHNSRPPLPHPSNKTK